jgi:hypothetical protein
MKARLGGSREQMPEPTRTRARAIVCASPLALVILSLCMSCCCLAIIMRLLAALQICVQSVSVYANRRALRKERPRTLRHRFSAFARPEQGRVRTDACPHITPQRFRNAPTCPVLESPLHAHGQHLVLRERQTYLTAT